MGKQQTEGGPSVWTETVRPCVWMTAGVIAYKLCDRRYECDGCPLDEALLGRRRAPSGPVSGERSSWAFPADRRYSAAHLWIERLGDHRARVGIDAFAALLLASACGIELPAQQTALRQGMPVARIQLGGAGSLALRAPVSGAVLRSNRALAREVAPLLDDPYGRGWLVDLQTDPAEPAPLLSSVDVREQARLDLQRFWRQLAVHLFSASTAPGGSDLGPTLNDGGVPLTDLRQILGGARYLELVESLLG